MLVPPTFLNGGRYWDRTSGPCRVKAVSPYSDIPPCLSMYLKYLKTSHFST